MYPTRTARMKIKVVQLAYMAAELNVELNVQASPRSWYRVDGSCISSHCCIKVTGSAALAQTEGHIFIGIAEASLTTE
jgi:hypothetical protein